MNRLIIAIAVLIPLSTVLFVTLNSNAKKEREEEKTATAVSASAEEQNAGKDGTFTVEITRENFEDLVKKSSTPVVLDFWASWCGPCMMLGPHLEEIAEEYDGKALVGKINTDEQPELALKFKATSIPLVVIMKDGKIVDGFKGFDAEVPDDIRAKIDALLRD